MKLIRIISLMALALVAVNAEAQPEPVKVPATYNKLYVPNGFDSNDHVQVVGEGLFRNSCYRPADTKVKVDQDRRQIFVGPAAYEYSGFCLQVVLPFDRVLDIGILKPGAYEFVQISDGAKLGSIQVRKATSDMADDYIYAPISQAFFRQKGLKSEIYLTGDFPNSCMALDEVRVDVQKDVIVVLPIAKYGSNVDCQDGKFHFEKMVQVDLIKPGRYLLHVRSMNSNAVNTLVDVK